MPTTRVAASSIWGLGTTHPSDEKRKDYYGFRRKGPLLDESPSLANSSTLVVSWVDWGELESGSQCRNSHDNGPIAIKPIQIPMPIVA